ncbi:class II aaRS and biotin synthetase [Wolfiporia cocos MD-104 SS10]|uniref:Class II aaRS and biotin synthetase n=1 Tax=Wolfiporia cocos (strain MD-104) TaxID=742152 RepID=A0A2H3JCK5_WOLCO|nr:class II aaRS and biotin synthetase [Wolfiporia cocos MD-104 SS10]
MNVLVYSGPEVFQNSLTHCIITLRTLLVPNYAVQSISPQSLISHPWTSNCALLVFPSCKRQLSAKPISSAVAKFVENGGSLLAIGATLAGSRKSSSLSESIGCSNSDIQQPLQLYHESSGAFVDIQYGDIQDSLEVSTVRTAGGCAVNGVMRVRSQNRMRLTESDALRPISYYVDDGEDRGVAALQGGFGAGRVVLWDALIDLPLTEEPVLSLLGSRSSSFLQETEKGRQEALRHSLHVLRLVLPEQQSTSTSPLPQFLTSTPSKPWIVSRIAQALSLSLQDATPHTWADSNDTFYFHPHVRSLDVLEAARIASADSDPASWQPKHVLVHTGGALPPLDETPLFDVGRFYGELAAARGQARCMERSDVWGIGEALLYGEVVTSTQTLLDKNPRLLGALPTPLLSLASRQLAGRGRGTNVWLSPAGCLTFSLLLRVPLSAFPPARLVFVQYLFALAVAEAVREPAVLGTAGASVRLKWPNDIYAVRGDGARAKIGGVLVNTSFTGGAAEVVIGCGLNVWNAPPIQSLLQLVPPESGVQLDMERTAATIMATFEKMWDEFLEVKGSFEPFLDLYYERWLHSDQLVELTTVTPPQKVRIVGITSDHGLLRTMPEHNGWSSGGASFIDLQPDGNSFDIMAGLIKAKK